MNTGSLITNELHLCNLSPLSRDLAGMERMEDVGNGMRATDLELDEALSRAIRQLIAEAIESGGASDHGASEHGVSDNGAGSAQAAA
jgi:hypothetical protein